MGVVRQLVKVILLFVLALTAFAGEARADEVTGFRNIKNVADLKQAESVTVTCTRKGEDRLATVVDRIVHQIPEGATTVTAAQLEELLKQTGETGNVLVIDTRSKVRYEARHIAGAVSVPIADLEKRGSMLLSADRSKTLVFY